MSEILPSVSASEAVEISVLLASIGLFIQGLEDSRFRGSFQISLLSWRIDRSAYREQSYLQKSLDLVFCDSVFSLLLVLRLLVPVLVVVSFLSGHAVPAWLIGTLLAMVFLFGLRSRHGLDGSHHMFLVVLLPCTVARIHESNTFLVQVCLAYIVAQLCLSYFIAGTVKVIDKSWRSGAALAGISTTDAYGHTLLSKSLERVPGSGVVICWSVILFELLFPSVLLVPEFAQIALISLALFLHVVLAVFMGLNKFVWAWWSAFPSLFWAVSPT